MSAEVGGGEAKGSSALGSGDNFAVQSEGVSEQFVGIAELTCDEQVADAAGGDHAVALIERGDFDEADVGLFTERFEQRCVAFAVVAEVEIGAFDDAAGVETSEQDFGEEFAGRHLQQVRSDGQDADSVDTGGGEEPGAFLDAGEHWWGGGGAQERQWVGVEGGSDGGGIEFGGQFPQGIQNLLVAPVHSVEVSQGEAAALV